MSKTSGQKDPSMDEILGSIRRIITEDSAQAGRAAEPAETVPAAADDDILDLTDALEASDEPDTRREPVLKSVEPASVDAKAEGRGERREPVLGIHSPVVEPAAEPPAASSEAAADAGVVAEIPGQEEEIAMAPSDESPATQDVQPEIAAEDIVSDTTSSATTAALSELSRAMDDKAKRLRLGEGDATVSDIVKELIRPMLREWIDQNLPTIVERVVRREIQKLVDRAPGDD